MRKKNKLAAFTLLLIHGLSVFCPGISYALTSGPKAPESSQFQSASITNLVDPFSGDFSYNIPLLDVDGYPINIAYNSGGSMDDEASWVGYGWNINPGSISRVMKGIPDDFNGKDSITKDYNIRPDITAGINFNAGLEIIGFDFIGANASADIFYNNYRGLGVEIGAGISATLSTAKHVSGEYTGGLSAGANLGITSNSQTGADFNFGISLGTSLKNKEGNTGALGLKFGGSINSRAGLKSTTLSGSFNTSKGESRDAETKRLESNKAKNEHVKAPGETNNVSYPMGSVTTSYGMAFNPTITMPMENESYSLSPQIGPEFWGLQLNLQATAHYTRQKLKTKHKAFPAYGFLHSNQGRSDANALLDFNREKDVPYMDNTPTLAVPYVTQDIFTATSQFGSSQFKAFSNSSGVFFDNNGSNTSNAFALGLEFGAGGGIKAGGDLSFNGSNTVTRKWTGNNDFLNNGDFSPAPGADGEDVYFKLVGERSSANKNYLARLADREPVKVRTGVVSDDAKAFSTLESNNKSYAVSSKIARNIREPKGEVFSPMTADNAGKFALDKKINNYTLATPTSTVTCNNGVFGNFQQLDRVSETHKGHHFSEVTVIKNDGIRLVYGVPVYNNQQTDITFNVGNATPDLNNHVHYSDNDNSTNNNKGVDYYFSKENVPAYATNFLLSGVCSPDYVDITGNGISDDDLGSAVKFNYTRVNAAYKWRTPNGRTGNSRYANFNKGLITNVDDDKASLSYGTKELWYTNSIESKNMIAVFRLEDRDDGYGYDEFGVRDDNSKQKLLRRVDLYTKAELLNNPANPTPVKSVHFDYDYSLFGNLPNNKNGGGKLTLKSIWFTYGKNTSGEQNRYYFAYNASGTFEYQQYDRWGNYKSKELNSLIAKVNLDNNDFPYSIQDETKANEAARKWQLSEIELPSGGKIKIEYESDDYAFVQDKRAMRMSNIVGYGSYGNYDNYQKTDKVYIQLPEATDDDKIKWQYFDGVDQLYFKSMIDLNNKGKSELVSGYAKIKSVKTAPGHADVAEVTLEKRGEFHPIAAAAWQFMRNSTPELAYPYSINRELSPLAFVKALVAAIGNVSELMTPFEEKAMFMKFGSHIIQGQGFARIGTNFKKYGGGSRVNKITMDDLWGEMSKENGSVTMNGKSSRTGMIFEYKKKYKTPDGVEKIISSGVASYEPMAGSEENPFKQPIPYQQKQHLTSNMFTVDEPLGESYFPAASVGYSEVTIKNLDAEGDVVNNGYSLKKFYTAKDFPTFVRRTDLSKNKYGQASIFGIFNIDQSNSVVLSQGFFVETNDMHGKPLSDESFDGSGKLLSGSYYHYKSTGNEQLALDNNALTLRPDGTVQNDLIGQEFEMFHDMREQVTDNIGINLNLNLDVIMFTFITVPIPTIIPIVQSSSSAYEAASTIKVISHYAIADKVTTIENGSTMISENILWDALTGEVLLTKTQNGFDDPLYNFSLPAYMVKDYEKGMGAAYQNTGILFKNITVNSGGQVPGSIQHLLVPGDELGIVDSPSGERVWVLDTDLSPGEDLRFIRRDGSVYAPGTTSLVVLRSGHRNLMGTSSYTVVSLKNPISGGKINIGQPTEILSTSANTFSDDWTAAAQYISCNSQPGGGGTGGKPNMINKVIADNSTGNNFKPINITELMKAGKSAPGESNIICNPCTDLNGYTFTFVPGPPNTTCVRVKFNCGASGILIPENTRVVFNIELTNSSVNAFGVVELTRANPDQVICFPISATGLQVNLGSWYCITKNENCGDICNNISNAFDIKTSWSNGAAIGLPGNICGDPHYGNVVVRYNCTTPFPANTTVRFTFSANCTPNSVVQSVELNSNNPDGVICFPYPPVLSNANFCPTVTLVSTECINTGTNCCPNPLNQKFNPYYTGLKGNWRGKESYVYTTARDPRVDPLNTAKLPTNTRKGGIFSAFNSFYEIQGGKFVRNSSDNKWIASATVTKVNNKGQEVENMDALGKYSTAQFGFNELVATAVGSNARNNEIGYDGFEDYAYSTTCNASTPSCNEDGHFNFKKQLGIANGSGFALSTDAAHTGNYSVKVSAGLGNSGGGIAFTKRSVVNSLADALLRYDINSNKEAILKEGGMLNDFRPMVGKKYVISGWIKGDVASEADPENTDKAKIVVEGFAGATSSGYKAIAVKAGPKVEGWTRVMTTFELPAGASIDNVIVKLVGGSAVAYFDDIRINPYDGNMKSFVYDYRTSRLMAELDENNYATFYEYNDEGQLMRNKKETEKGIVTLKETRSRLHTNLRP